METTLVDDTVPVLDRAVGAPWAAASATDDGTTNAATDAKATPQTKTAPRRQEPKKFISYDLPRRSVLSPESNRTGHIGTTRPDLMGNGP
jgi:hypothetical protein